MVYSRCSMVFIESFRHSSSLLFVSRGGVAGAKDPGYGAVKARVPTRRTTAPGVSTSTTAPLWSLPTFVITLSKSPTLVERGSAPNASLSNAFRCVTSARTQLCDFADL